MSRDAEVIVLARHADEVMEPLTRQDTERTWHGHFVPISGQWGFDFGWALEFDKVRARHGLLRHLESLPRPYPGTVQVLLRDQDDDCFGLWMFRDGRLVEVAIERTERFHRPAPPDERFEPAPGMLLRTDPGADLPEQTPEELRDPRPAW
ncbi:hypothetical protein ACIBSV_42880 [Embleya sp. NPDC050154]|uniref:hypothetical protein n=1 Tax=Embleya sp. NPDC050154 TaxID=3363988 RepID=UPI0037A5FDFD